MPAARGRRRSTAALVTAAALAPLLYGAWPGAPVAATTGPGDTLSVEGYVLGWGGGKAAYLGDARTVDVAGVDGVELRPTGGGITAVPRPSLPVLHAAHRHHDAAELLVSNYSEAIGDFDPALAHRMLSRPPRRHQVAAALARVVRRDGWDGIQIDLESLRQSDGPGLVAFGRALRAALPARAGISMAVMAETSAASYRHHGYLLRHLRSIDRFVLMAYDQHGPGWSGPGPVGALPWARRTARPLVAAVGRGRVDLGIAGYGYLWTPSGGHSVSDRRARHLAGAAGVWHPRVGEWSARVPAGTLWWSDGRSFARRVALAHDLRVHGVAVWQLGSADHLTD